jgi:hypothetical protein
MNNDRPRIVSAESGVSSPPEANEICEIFVAELVARRKRLKHLLRLVTQAADRALKAQADTAHPRCRPATKQNSLGR